MIAMKFQRLTPCFGARYSTVLLGILSDVIGSQKSKMAASNLEIRRAYIWTCKHDSHNILTAICFWGPVTTPLGTSLCFNTDSPGSKICLKFIHQKMWKWVAQRYTEAYLKNLHEQIWCLKNTGGNHPPLLFTTLSVVRWLIMLRILLHVLTTLVLCRGMTAGTRKVRRVPANPPEVEDTRGYC